MRTFAPLLNLICCGAAATANATVVSPTATATSGTATREVFKRTLTPPFSGTAGTARPLPHTGGTAVPRPTDAHARLSADDLNVRPEGGNGEPERLAEGRQPALLGDLGRSDVAARGDLGAIQSRADTAAPADLEAVTGNCDPQMPPLCQ